MPSKSEEEFRKDLICYHKARPVEIDECAFAEKVDQSCIKPFRDAQKELDKVREVIRKLKEGSEPLSEQRIKKLLEALDKSVELFQECAVGDIGFMRIVHGQC